MYLSRRRTSTIVALVLASSFLGFLAKRAHAGVEYQDPTGGWRYKYTGIFNPPGGVGGYPPGYGNASRAQALDGTWQHDQADKWDGSGIGDTGPTPGGPAPGGVQTFVDKNTTYIRVQDTGNPELFGYTQNTSSGMHQNTNRRENFGHIIANDGALPSELVLDQGITISFRARIPNSGPLDSIYTDTNFDGTGTPQILPWGSVGGGGYPIHDNGRGMFYVIQNDPDNFNFDSTIAFSMMTNADRANYTAVPTANPGLAGHSRGGLIMNNLNGDTANGAIDTFSPGTLNLLEMDDSQLYKWNEFWITIQDNGATPGTHQVNVYLNGATTATTFNVTATGDGNGEFKNAAYLAMGLSSDRFFGAFDLDFYAYKLGVFAPVRQDNPDTNGDGIVDISDIQVIASKYLTTGPDGDANHDGLVDVSDIQVIAAHWLQSWPPGGNGAGAAVPEPATLGLIALGLPALAIVTRRRQRS